MLKVVAIGAQGFLGIRAVIRIIEKCLGYLSLMDLPQIFDDDLEFGSSAQWSDGHGMFFLPVKCSDRECAVASETNSASAATWRTQPRVIARNVGGWRTKSCDWWREWESIPVDVHVVFHFST